MVGGSDPVARLRTGAELFGWFTAIVYFPYVIGAGIVTLRHLATLVALLTAGFAVLYGLGVASELASASHPVLDDYR